MVIRVSKEEKKDSVDLTEGGLKAYPEFVSICY